MNEPTPSPPIVPPSAHDATVPYRSVSVPALAGLAVSGLFTAWLTVTAVDALRTGKPLLIQPLWLLVPLAGAVVSGLGWLQIHHSEGARVGARLARWGVLLGVLAALSYGAWYGTTELALRLQAREFTDGWFEALRQSKADDRYGYAAFWCSAHPLRRDGSFGDLSSAADRDALVQSPQLFPGFRDSLRGRYLWGERGRKGALPFFFEHEAVQLVRQAGTEAEVESLGVRDWEYIGGSEPGYKVDQTYRLQTPDGTFEITVPVLSLDKDRRRWRVLLGEAQVTQREPTPRGRLVAQLRLDSHRFVGEWLHKLNEGDEAEVVLLPTANDLMVMDSPSRLKEVTDEIVARLGRSGKDRKLTFYLGQMAANSPSRYEVTAGKPQELIFHLPFEGRVGDKHHCEGLVAVATADPQLVSLEASDAAVASSTAARRKRWRIVGVQLLRGGELAPPAR